MACGLCFKAGVVPLGFPCPEQHGGMGSFPLGMNFDFRNCQEMNFDIRDS